MINDFNAKPRFPFTYGDDIVNDGERLSDFIVNKLSEKKTRNYIGSVAMAALALGAQVPKAYAIPPEYGEAANNIINQAAQTGATVPPIGDIKGHVPNVPGGEVPEVPRCFIPAMPIEQQRLIAAQQAGQLGGHLNPQRPASPPTFWSPKAPVTDMQKFRSTLIFIISTAGVCSQAGWNPIAQIMCASGLALSSLAISKPAFIAMFRMFGGGGS